MNKTIKYVSIILLIAASNIIAMQSNKKGKQAGDQKVIEIPLPSERRLSKLTSAERKSFFAEREKTIRILSDPMTETYFSVSRGDFEQVEQDLNENHFDLNQLCGPDQITLLHNACANGFLPIIKLLLRLGADPNVALPDGTTPLHMACLNGHLGAVVYLVHYGADITIQTNEGRSVRDFAVLSPKENFFNYFNNLFGPTRSGMDDGHGQKRDRDEVHTGSLPDTRKEKTSKLSLPKRSASEPEMPMEQIDPERAAQIELWKTPAHKHLYAAIDVGNSVWAQRIVEVTQINMNELIGPMDMTLLHRAALRGNVQIAKMLIDCGADLNITMACGKTALHIAAQMGHRDMVEFLIQSGADMYAKTKDNKTPKALAQENKKDQVVQLLNESIMAHAHRMR